MEKVTGPLIIQPAESPSLNQALPRIAKSWCHLNWGVYSRILEQCKNSKISSEQESFFKSIHTDPALYSHLLSLLEADRRNPPPLSELLSGLSLEALEALKERESVTLYQSETQTPSLLQALSLAKILASSHTAALLCKHQNIDPELGFSTALLRQIGDALLAWSFEEEYSRALLAISPRKGIEGNLSLLLGFSALDLTLHLTRDWSLPPEVRIALGDARRSTFWRERALPVGLNLQEICSVGEMLAKGYDPLHYPEARALMVAAQREIVSRVGEERYEQLQQDIEQALTTHNALTKLGLTLGGKERKRFVQSSTDSSLPKEDKYLPFASPSLQADLLRLATEKKKAGVLDIELERLLRHTLPCHGFKRGAIFFIDPDCQGLVPRMAVGVSHLGEFEMVRVADLPTSFAPAAIGYRAASAWIDNGTNPPFGTAPLGGPRPFGVLLLHLPPCPTNGELQRALDFKAIWEGVEKRVEVND